MTKSIFIGNETKLFFLFMVIIALRFLRDNSIVHIDLKPENLLMKIVGDGKQSVHYLIKLIDFGESYSSKIDMLSGIFLID
jgi:serine/threonine protein kinase